MKTEIIVTKSWAEQLRDYHSWLAAAARPSSTIYKRLYDVRRFAARTGLEPFEPTLADLLKHVSNPRWSPGTRRAARSSLRAFYSWAYAVGRIDSDPSAAMPSIYVAPGRKREPADDAALRLGLHAVDARVPLMVELAERAGLRCCEIAVVHYRDVVGTPVARSLRVHGKGGKKRTVPISTGLAAAILERSFGGFLFPGRIDGHLSTSYVSKMMSRELGEATAHMLRHRAATRVYRNSGNDIRAAQDFLGHASVATTQIYVAVDHDRLREAVLAA